PVSQRMSIKLLRLLDAPQYDLVTVFRVFPDAAYELRQWHLPVFGKTLHVDLDKLQFRVRNVQHEDPLALTGFAPVLLERRPDVNQVANGLRLVDMTQQPKLGKLQHNPGHARNRHPGGHLTPGDLEMPQNQGALCFWLGPDKLQD